MAAPQQPVFFANAAALRRWFAKYAHTESVLIAGFMKRGTGVESVTWPESVDEALCVGWIDGVRHRIDNERYRIRFTPRKPGSHWSNINIRKVTELKKAGRMKAAGLKAFAARSKAKSGRASYEQKKPATLTPQDIRLFKQNPAAWKYYGAVPPGYRQLYTYWVTSAKKADTHDGRLRKLIEACAKGRRLS
jgi:uncharacterized protein YdeI (YjbR/CyaY-like superfamily)